MNKNFSFLIGRASGFGSSYIATFNSLLTSSGQVIMSTFNELIEKDPILIMVYDNSELVGIGALKIPHVNYAISVFQKSGVSFEEKYLNSELGWVISKKNGVGSFIVEKLSSLTKNTYATVRSDGYRMKRVLEKNNFKRVGVPYSGRSGSYNIELYVK